jgi:protein phosphatase
VQLVSAALTDLGLRRPANEDSHIIRPGLGLYGVCDGMGGHAAGEVASHVAARAIEDFIQHTDGATENFTWPFPFRREWGLDGNRLVSAFLLANRELRLRVLDEPALRGMATTAVCVLISPGAEAPGLRSTARTGAADVVVPDAVTPDDVALDAFVAGGLQPPGSASLPALVAHVGDSRAYLWRDGDLDQITRDHSWVEEQIALGALNVEEARQHPWRNLVTRALAGADEPAVDLTPVALAPGDRVLICSDGLTSAVTNDAIAEILARTPMGRPDELCQALVDAANGAGGPDNITVIVVEIM